VGASPALLVVRTDRGSTLHVTNGAALQIRGLRPDSEEWLELVTMDLAGETRSASAALHTRPARAHVLLTEVLADPDGPEPEGEMVELWNDGTRWGSSSWRTAAAPWIFRTCSSPPARWRCW
jgi:hypothetical protein